LQVTKETKNIEIINEVTKKLEEHYENRYSERQLKVIFERIVRDVSRKIIGNWITSFNNKKDLSKIFAEVKSGLEQKTRKSGALMINS
jgi:hypothetical protein